MGLFTKVVAGVLDTWTLSTSVSARIFISILITRNRKPNMSWLKHTWDVIAYVSECGHRVSFDPLAPVMSYGPSFSRPSTLPSIVFLSFSGSTCCLPHHGDPHRPKISPCDGEKEPCRSRPHTMGPRAAAEEHVFLGHPHSSGVHSLSSLAGSCAHL